MQRVSETNPVMATPDHSCLISGARIQGHSTTHARALRAAAVLARLGIGENDSIAFILRNDFAFFEATLAAEYLGAYAVPINWHATVAEAEYILHDSGAKAFIVHGDLLEGLRNLSTQIPVIIVETPVEIAAAYAVRSNPIEWKGALRWEDIASASAELERTEPVPRGAMIYTSGTTGQPKGVRRACLSRDTTDRIMARTAVGYGLAGDAPKIVLMNGPMYHAAPNSYGQLAFRGGAKIILQPRFNAEEMLAFIQDHAITHMHIVPVMMHRLLCLPAQVRASYDVSSLVDVVHGAAPCAPRIKRDLMTWWGPVVSEYYGSTETGLITRITSPEALLRPGSVGRPLGGVEVRIFKNGDEEAAVGQPGDIYVRSEQTDAFAYHGDAAKTARARRDGFVTVGDIGYLAADGYLYLTDRRHDIIISGGVNIYPAEIEAALMSVAGVNDCAVFGIPDEEFGESVCAHVEPAPDNAISAEYLVSELEKTLARYKIPRRLVLADRLPREDSGKIFKKKLRSPYWANAGRRI
jgi:long-chain acyl-CoA synthetase